MKVHVYKFNMYMFCRRTEVLQNKPMETEQSRSICSYQNVYPNLRAQEPFLLFQFQCALQYILF
jgi:hypothetical protein